jgi:hypothetical protein
MAGRKYQAITDKGFVFAAGLVGQLCNLICCGNCNCKGESGRPFPRNEKALRKMGKEWLSKELTDPTTPFGCQGGIKANDKVISMGIVDMNDGGLLGELIRIDIKTANGIEKSFVVKFVPQDFKTRITVSLFLLHETEFKFYSQCQPALAQAGLRAPALMWGDINYLTGNFCIMIEAIKGDFFKIQDHATEVTLERVEKMVDATALLHCTYWGDLCEQPTCNFLKHLSHPMFALLASEAKRHFKTYLTGGAGPANMSAEIEAATPEILRRFEGKDGLRAHWTEGGWKTFVHGDTRIDNFFFNEQGDDGGSVGLLDWQLCGKGSALTDLSWTIATTLSAEFMAANGVAVKRRYFDALKTGGGGQAKWFTYEQFEQELALAHIYCYIKVIIGCGGTGSDENSKTVMHQLAEFNLAAMLRDDSLGAFRRFVAKGSAAFAAGAPSGGPVRAAEVVAVLDGSSQEATA